MKSKIFTVLLLVGLCSAAPTSKTPKITKNSYQDAEVIYEGNHDIVNLLIPLNQYRFEESKYPNPKTLALPLFFIEADIDENGNREYQGVYLLLNGRAEKIFENGRDFALVTDDSKMVYLAAGDGLHTYNVKNKTTTKYGTLNDSIINIAHEGNEITMNLKIFTAVLLVGLTSAAPTSMEDYEKLTINKEYYPQQFVKYEGSHDIVSIVVPLNSINFDEDDSSESDSDEDESEIVMFFVEADTDENKKRTYHGLYTLKDGKVKKVLENGRDAASSADNSRTVYFAASDGLYTYKEDDQTAVKYGSLNDSIIGIAHIVEGDVLYILTDDHTVYEVKNNGNEKVKLEDVVEAQQIVLDYTNNLYYYTPDKKVYVKTTEGIKNIEGLPESSTNVTLIKAPFIIENGIPVLIDNVAYIVYSNGTSEHSGFDFQTDAIPSAFAMEAALFQYYAYDKKIYEYNILLLVLGEILDELKNFLSNKTSEIQSLASNRRPSLQSN